MGGLYKKEILVKPTSTATKEQAIAATRTFVNSFQNAAANKDGNGNFIDYFFGDCYDSRNGNIYRVFSDACSGYYAMPNTDGLVKYDIIDNDVLALKSEIPSVDGLASTTYVDDAIAGIDTGGSVDLTEVNNTLSDHTNRIVALESSTSGEAAFVIE